MFIFAPRDNMSTTRQGATNRRNRYTRSSTTSVTQLLSDSCSNLLQRLTTRVRGPSSTVDRSTIRTSPIASHLGLTRSRLEDKYSSILDRYSGKKQRDDETRNNNVKRREEREHSYFTRESSPFVREDKTLEPSMPHPIAKSATSVLLSEKAYPYVSSATSRDLHRDKTPGYHRTDRKQLGNSEAYRRYGRHKSGHAETRNRKVRPIHRQGKSEQLDDSTSTGNKLLRNRPHVTLASTDTSSQILLDLDKTPTIIGNDVLVTIPNVDNDEAITEREAKRKEIQTLIMKYAAIDEAYANSGGSGGEQKPSTADIIASKYQRNGAQKSVARADAKTVDTITSAIVSLSRTRV